MTLGEYIMMEKKKLDEFGKELAKKNHENLSSNKWRLVFEKWKEEN